MALLLTIKVIPSSGKQQWRLDKSNVLKCFLKSPPEKGKANAELIKLLANALEIPQAMIEIVGGATARTKRIKIDRAITHAQVLSKLGLEAGIQHALF